MGNSYISSFNAQIYQARHSDVLVSYATKFGTNQDGGSLDIIDILERLISIPETFSGIEATLENDVSVPGASNRINVPSINKNGSKMSLAKKCKKGIECNAEGVQLFKYLFFQVKHGESGDKYAVEKPNGNELDVSPNDFTHHWFYVFIAFPCDPSITDGVVMIESKNGHSIQTSVKNLLKRCVRKIDGTSYVMKMQRFVTRDAVEEYIKQNKVVKLRLVTNKASVERGEAAGYEQKEIVYTTPSGDKIMTFLTKLCENIYVPSVKSGIKEIDDFGADKIKFTVKNEHGTRTYTAGDIKAGLIQTDVTEEVVQPDGLTNEREMMKQMKELYLEQHFTVVN